MKYRSFRAVAPVALMLAAWAAPAGAQLNMQFEGNQTRICVNSNAGFDANLALLAADAVTVTGLDKRVITFNPDGTGTVTGRSLSLRHDNLLAGSTPSTEFDVSCTFTYTLNAATRVVSTIGTCDSTALAGPGIGQTSRSSNVAREAVFLQNGNVLVNEETTPAVEILTNLTTGFVFQRICHRTATSYRKR